MKFLRLGCWIAVILLAGFVGYSLFDHPHPSGPSRETRPGPAPAGEAAPEEPSVLIGWLGTTRYVQDVTEIVMNAWGGLINRRFNDAGVKKQQRKTPLPNFGQVDAYLFRGGQPSEEGFRQLRDRWGVTDILNLRRENNEEDAAVKKLGLAHHYLPIPDTCAPTASQGEEFRRLVGDITRKGGRLFLHCAGGRGRTGTLVGVYRLDQGWPLDRIRTEMERFGWKENWFRQREQWRTLRELERKGKSQGKGKESRGRTGKPL